MDVERLLVRLTADATIFTGVLDTAEARLVYFAATVAEVFVRQSAVMAATYEKSAIAFETMSKSADEGKRILNEINNLAVESPFHSAELVDYAKQLQSFGFAGDQLVPILQTLGDVASGTGGRMDRIVLAFGQVRTAGRLMGQELRQFTNAGIPLMENLAAVMNKPVDQITHMVHTGQVGFNDVVRAFNRMTQEGGKFAGLMDRINKETVAGRWENMTERIQLSMRKIGEAFFEGFDVKDTLDKFGGVFDKLKKEDATEVFRNVRNGILFALEAGNRLGNWFEAIGKDVMAAVRDVEVWVRTHQQSVRIIAITIGLIAGYAAVTKTLAVSLLYLTTIVRGVTAVFVAFQFVLTGMGLVTSITSFVSAIASLAAAAAPVLVIVAAFATVAALLDEMNAFEGTLKGFGQWWQEMAKTAAGAWEGITAAVKRGDIQSAFDVIQKTVEYGWASMLIRMAAEWDRFSSRVVFKLSDKSGDLFAGVRLMSLDLVRDIEMRATTSDGSPERAAYLKSWMGERNKILDENRDANIKSMKDLDDSIARSVESSMKALEPMRQAIRDAVGKAKFPDLPDNLARYRRPDLLALPPGFAGHLDNPETPGMSAIMGGVAPHAMVAQTAVARKAQDLIWLYDRLTEKARAGTLEPWKLEKIPIVLKNVQEAVAAADKFYGVNTDGMHKRVGEMLQVSARAQDTVAHLNKTLQDGIDPMEKFENKIADLNEAFRGPLPALEAIGGVAAAMAAGQKGIIDEDQYRKGLYLQYMDLKKSLGDKAGPNLPPAAMVGSRDAQDIINRTLQQEVDVHQEVLRNIMIGNAQREQNLIYQKKVADSLERLEKGGTKIMGKGL